jgi:hypothetical protein
MIPHHRRVFLSIFRLASLIPNAADNEPGIILVYYLFKFDPLRYFFGIILNLHRSRSRRQSQETVDHRDQRERY